MTNDLWLSIQAHRESQRKAGKYRCTYERTVVRFLGEPGSAGDWVCGECGEVLFSQPDKETD